MTVCVTTIVAILIAVVVTIWTTPMYQASTRLFVSTTAGSSLSDAYQGNRFSQERVVSYSELLTGETLAQRTIDKLGLNMRASELRDHVKAAAKPDTVLINVDVLDSSPVRARDIANTMSDEFVALVKELETPANGAEPDARVVVEQRASIPEHPIIPKTARNMAVGIALGLLLGVAFAFGRDVLDNSVKSRESLEEITGSAVVGLVPLDKERRKNPAISFDSDNSAIAEAFRKLRTNLQFLAVDNPPRVIVVTSSLPHEGKSTTAINTALALAELEYKVVLVDGDMRRPMLHRYLDLVQPVGFSTVLSGSATLDDALQKTRFDGLTVLTSGAIPPNPSELLGTQSARKALAELRSKFDFVIIDSTPLLAVTDAAILAAGADGVLVMARFASTKRDQLAHAVETLRSVGAPLLGSVFTMMPIRGGAAYSYNYTYYGADATGRNAPSSHANNATAEQPRATNEKSHSHARAQALADGPEKSAKESSGRAEPRQA